MKKLIALVLLFVFVFPLSCSFVSADENGYIYIKADALNAQVTSSTLVIYTEKYGESVSSNGVQLTKVAVDGNGIVQEVSLGDVPIPEGGFVLCGGTDKMMLLDGISVGDTAVFDEDSLICIAVSEEYTPFVTNTLKYDAVNAIRSENKMIIYRNKATTETNIWGYEVCVDKNGTVVSVGGNNNAIPDGGYVVSGVGTRKSELEAAVLLGYSATLDESQKTVTFSYTIDNAFQSYELRLEQIKKEYNDLYDNFASIDYKKTALSLSILEDACTKIKSALLNGNIAEFLLYSAVFENESKNFDDLKIPYVPVETRCLWIRIPVNSSETVVRSTVKEIYDMGFNSVCIEALFDSTTIMPMPEDSLFVQNPAFYGADMLRMYLDEFHEYGIEVHLWMSCYRVGHEGSGNVRYSVAKKKPEWLVLDQAGSYVVNNEYGDAYFLNPALPEVKNFLLDTYRYILENYDVDGFQLDYVRYPENTTMNYGYDEYTKSLFMQEYGYTTVPTASGQRGWDDWCKFRASFVTDLVKSVGEMIKDIRPDVIFSCDVAPEYSVSLSKMCQDTQTWLDSGLVDMVFPMAYGTTDAVVKWTVNTVALAGDSINTVIGLRDNGPEIYREQIIAARQNGATGSAFFSYGQYAVGDYKDFIANTVFAERAICPTYNATDACVAQLGYISKTIKDKIISRLSTETQISSELLSELESYSNELIITDVEGLDFDINNEDGAVFKLLNKSKELISALNDCDEELCKNAGRFLEFNINIANNILVNSKDKEKAAYQETLKKDDAIVDESFDVSDEASKNDDNTYTPNTFEKTFQVVSLIILFLGFVGLPAYYFLNVRKNRIANNTDDEAEDDIGSKRRNRNQ